ncbi:MAG: hypothetical protein GVY35_03125 [Bacteroidetes bacterium]|jgi:hypothetical protein|nr:hypothetical protein [Bacteroidota bacterium]
MLTIAVICLYPPWAVTEHRSARSDGDRAVTAMDRNGGVSAGDPKTPTQITYRGIFMPGQWTSADGDRTYTAHVHIGRLLLQIMAAALIFGGLAYGIGPLRHNEEAVQQKMQEYDQSL